MGLIYLFGRAVERSTTSRGGMSLFGHRLITRIMLTSVVMSGCCGRVAGQLCAEDEFYDAVVDECALCSDVCDLCLAPESQTFCIRNCPDYYSKMQRSRTGCVPTNKAPSPMTSASQSQQTGNHVTSSSSSWSSNPLIWTSIISLSVAMVATIVIVPLVVCVQVRKHCKGKRATGERQQSTPSAAYSAVENGNALPQSKTSPIYLPQNGLKQKSDMLLESEYVVMTSRLTTFKRLLQSVNMSYAILGKS